MIWWTHLLVELHTSHSYSITLSRSLFCTEWQSTSICLVRWWKTDFDSIGKFWQIIFVGCDTSNPSSGRNCFNQTNLYVVSSIALYSTSAFDLETVSASCNSWHKVIHNIHVISSCNCPIIYWPCLICINICFFTSRWQLFRYNLPPPCVILSTSNAASHNEEF